MGGQRLGAGGRRQGDEVELETGGRSLGRKGVVKARNYATVAEDGRKEAEGGTRDRIILQKGGSGSKDKRRQWLVAVANSKHLASQENEF